MRYSGQCACRAAARPLSERRSGTVAARASRTIMAVRCRRTGPEVSARAGCTICRTANPPCAPCPTPPAPRPSRPSTPSGSTSVSCRCCSAGSVRCRAPSARRRRWRTSSSRRPARCRRRRGWRFFASRRRRIDRPHSRGAHRGTRRFWISPEGSRPIRRRPTPEASPRCAPPASVTWRFSTEFSRPVSAACWRRLPPASARASARCRRSRARPPRTGTAPRSPLPNGACRTSSHSPFFKRPTGSSRASTARRP